MEFSLNFVKYNYISLFEFDLFLKLVILVVTDI